jgi:hypothetical protein
MKCAFVGLMRMVLSSLILNGGLEGYVNSAQFGTEKIIFDVSFNSLLCKRDCRMMLTYVAWDSRTWILLSWNRTVIKSYGIVLGHAF